MTARDDYSTLAFRSGSVERERPTPALYSERTELNDALDEIDRLRAGVILQGLIVNPGDTLIVRVAQNATLDQLAKVKRQIHERLPELADVLVMNADEIAVYRP